MSASEGKATRQAGFKSSTNGLSAYLFVALDAAASTVNETVIKQATAGAQILGISYEATTAANRNVGVNLDGICYLKVDGNTAAISAGDRLKSDANGKGVPVAANNDEYGAIALAASSADDDVIPVLIQKAINGQ